MMDEPRDCKHGKLARSCDRCADAAEIAELRAEAEALRAAPWIGRCQACGHEHEAVRAKASADVEFSGGPAGQSNNEFTGR